MKQWILITFAAALSFSSCRKCHQCELKESVNGYQLSASSSEFCGSNRKMRQHESENSSTRSATIDQTTITYTKDMDCE